MEDEEFDVIDARGFDRRTFLFLEEVNRRGHDDQCIVAGLPGYIIHIKV